MPRDLLAAEEKNGDLEEVAPLQLGILADVALVQLEAEARGHGLRDLSQLLAEGAVGLPDQREGPRSQRLASRAGRWDRTTVATAPPAMMVTIRS
jgi:hypothetical protein